MDHPLLKACEQLSYCLTSSSPTLSSPAGSPVNLLSVKHGDPGPTLDLGPCYSLSAGHSSFRPHTTGFSSGFSSAFYQKGSAQTHLAASVTAFTATLCLSFCPCQSLSSHLSCLAWQSHHLDSQKHKNVNSYASGQVLKLL